MYVDYGDKIDVSLWLLVVGGQAADNIMHGKQAAG